MKRLLLTVILLLSMLPAGRGDASGSNTVYLTLRLPEYVVTDAIRDLIPNKKLYDILESYTVNAYIATVTPELYQYVMSVLYWGEFNVSIEFEKYDTVVFEYYPFLNAILGKNSDGDFVILQPKITKPNTSPPVSENDLDEDCLDP